MGFGLVPIFLCCFQTQDISLHPGLNNLDFRLGYGRLLNQDYDLVIVESSLGLLLIDDLMKRLPSATFIYRVSDCLEILDFDPSLIELERQLLPKFDLVSNVLDHIADRLRKQSSNANIQVQEHGIHKSLFDQAKSRPSPYGAGLTCCICCDVP